MKWGMTLAAILVIGAEGQVNAQEEGSWQKTRFQPPVVVEENAINGPTGFSPPAGGLYSNGTVPNLDESTSPPSLGGDRPVYPVHTGMPPMVVGPDGQPAPQAPGVAGPVMGGPHEGCGVPMPGCGDCCAPFDGCVPLTCQPECDSCCESRCPLVRLLSGCCGGGCCWHGDCCCPKPWYKKWCLCEWIRSTGDMPQHFPYPPENHGTFYFRPYNYSHIQIARDLVPTHQSDPIAPYETHLVFNRVYKDVIPLDAPKPTDYDRPPDVEEEPPLPILEDLLDPEAARKRQEKEEAARKARMDAAKAKKNTPMPPLPKLPDMGKKPKTKKPADAKRPTAPPAPKKP